MSSFIEEALRERLATQASKLTAPLPTYGTAGTAAFRIDISDRDAVWEALDSGEADGA